MKTSIRGVLSVLLVLVTCCGEQKEPAEKPAVETRPPKISEPANKTGVSSMEIISKPYARYWWFASEIKEEDVKFNLDWLKANGFGGVEIAWVYPLNAKDKSMDPGYTYRQEWLSPKWRDIVSYTVTYADSIGLACDLTMGTLWPFGDSNVPYEQAAQQYGEEKRQKITRSWEYPKEGYVVGHLNEKNYMPYFSRMLKAFPRPKTKIPQSYFIDSWEVETKKIWADGFKEEFIKEYNYDISPFMESIYAPDNKERLYDYMKLVSKKVLRFYQNYDKVLNENGLFSRGQCSGAPTDMISAYASLDIPEGEAMLYEPEYNVIPASAAALSSKKIVSTETFTCLYGWPGQHIREEQTADLKMVADALFARGVNHIVWHGKPHNKEGEDSVSFYATVHLGQDGTLASELPSFNKYLASVSEIMKKGKAYSDVAVYLPTEDAWVKGVKPREEQYIWSWGYYEMRDVHFKEELAGHHPIWINEEFLKRGVFEGGQLKVGDASFNSLYVDATYLDFDVLRRIGELANQGLSVTLKTIPKEPGTVKHEKFDAMILKMKELPNVQTEFKAKKKPLVEGDNLPHFWAREDGDILYVFIANPKSKNMNFPLEYGQSFSEGTLKTQISVNYKGENSQN